MQRSTAGVAVCVLCWAMLGGVKATGFSISTLNFLAIFNGFYDNSAQVHNAFTKHELITSRVVPVDVPVLRPAAVLYMEWAVDGNVLDMMIGVVTEGPGENIYITLYNFTDIRLFRAGEFNVSKLSDLKSEEIQGNNCTVVFKRLSQAVFIGSIPDCRSTIRKHHPDFADTFTCDSISTIIPPTEQELFTPVPYVFQRKGPRYPMIGLPDTYDSICGKTWPFPSSC